MSNKMQVAPTEVDRVSAPVCGQKLRFNPPPLSNEFDDTLLCCANTMPREAVLKGPIRQAPHPQL